MHQAIKSVLDAKETGVSQFVRKCRRNDGDRWIFQEPTDKKLYAACVMTVRKAVAEGYYWQAAVDQVALQYGMAPGEWDRLTSEARQHLSGE